ncbi:hypothetical protein ACQB60_07385 [Actinomycetota bacterium Odt1-20B]
MSKSWNGRAATSQPSEEPAPAVGARKRRLATLLAEMVPGACIIRVSLREPGYAWPSPYARAFDKQGELIRLNRAQGVTAARWIIRAHPEVPWDGAYDLDLAAATLRPAVEAYVTTDGRR